MKKEQIICSECGAILTEETIHEFDGQIMCEHCLNVHTAICECCGERIWRDNAESDGHITICYHCYENSYHYCCEFRLFRGTLKYKTFLATLQFVDMICRLAIMLDDSEFEKMSWSDFV